MRDLLNTEKLAEKLPITAAFLGAHTSPTEFHFAVQCKQGGVLLEWRGETKPMLWHVECLRLEDILSDYRGGRVLQLIVQRLPTVVYNEMRLSGCNMDCRQCHASILMPPRTMIP